MKKWNEREKFDKAIIIIRIIISIIAIVIATIQLLGICDNAINLAVPLLGVLILLQSIQEWKTSKSIAILGLCSAVFIFICSFVVFFMS